MECRGGVSLSSVGYDVLDDEKSTNTEKKSNRLKFAMCVVALVVLVILLGLTIVGWLPMFQRVFNPPQPRLPYVKGSFEVVEITKVEPDYNGGSVTIAGGRVFEVNERFMRSVVANGKARLYSALGVTWLSLSDPILPVVADDYEPIEGMTEITDASDLKEIMWPSDDLMEHLSFAFCFSLFMALACCAFQKMKEYM